MKNEDLRRPNGELLTPDVVLLLPGLLGFTRFGNFYYFADRVSALLRGNLDARIGRSIPVIPCSTLPTSNLAGRQKHLLSIMRKLMLDSPLRGVERFHLVGHSTGGVDGELMTRSARADDSPWNHDDELRRRVGSVVTLSAPHYGSRITNSAVAQLIAHPAGVLETLSDPQDAASLTRTVADLVRLGFHWIAPFEAFELGFPWEVVKFVRQVIDHRELIDDLQPVSMEWRRATLTRDHPVPIAYFATAAEPRVEIEPPSDPFFRDIYEATRDTESQNVSESVRVLADALTREIAANPDKVICSSTGQRPAQVDPGLNDGVVNTARQVIEPTLGETFGGLVIADHCDVMGHYDRRDVYGDGRPINAGLFHSGAGFGDEEFFTLYERVAETLERGIRAPLP